LVLSRLFVGACARRSRARHGQPNLSGLWPGPRSPAGPGVSIAGASLPSRPAGALQPGIPALGRLRAGSAWIRPSAPGTMAQMGRPTPGSRCWRPTDQRVRPPAGAPPAASPVGTVEQRLAKVPIRHAAGALLGDSGTHDGSRRRRRSVSQILDGRRPVSHPQVHVVRGHMAAPGRGWTNAPFLGRLSPCAASCSPRRVRRSLRYGSQPCPVYVVSLRL
jgi:hypothetical protein